MSACCLFPCIPVFSLCIRQKVMFQNNVPGGCSEEWKGLCCACSLFQIYISMDEWEMEKKSLTKTNSARKKEEMMLKAAQMKKKKKEEEKLPPIPTQHNNITELVMTYMGDIMDDDEDDLSDDEDYSDAEEDDPTEYYFQDSEHKDNAMPRAPSPMPPTKVDMVQVTIPPGHFAGSIFQIENNAGDILEVVVPTGGKPGMKMQVPNQVKGGGAGTSSPPPPPSYDSVAQQESSTVEVPDGVIEVAIPPGHFEGAIFLIQNRQGAVLEVEVPAGGRPGMKMQVPNAFSQIPAPVAGTTTTPAPAPRVKPKPIARVKSETYPDPPEPPASSSTKPPELKKTKSKKRSVSPHGSRKIQVTIPEGVGPGDVFELQPAHSHSHRGGAGSGNIKVRVPQGGRPGMRILIRLPSLSSPEKEPKKVKEVPLRKQPPVMRDSPRNKQRKQQTRTVMATIPSGVVEGEPFMALNTSTGHQLLVIVPPGARAGMVMAVQVVDDNA